MSLPPTHPNWPDFTLALQYTFRTWTALNLCIDNQLAGRDTPAALQSLLDHTLQFFRDHGTEVFPYELADNFVAYFDEVFQTDLDDGSPKQVGESLCRLYREIMVEGKMEGLQALQVKVDRLGGGNAGARASVRQGGEGEDDDDDDDSDFEDDEGTDGDSAMDVDAPSSSSPAPKPEPVVDEDGFELVQKKGRGGRRH
ncbi:hypothetical protein HDV00_010152 [Rhizophlyctis rosea]|nr:hypothetical protein HDV00_010152 [Rhizophlyctis rosea]